MAQCQGLGMGLGMGTQGPQALLIWGKFPVHTGEEVVGQGFKDPGSLLQYRARTTHITGELALSPMPVPCLLTVPSPVCR